MIFLNKKEENAMIRLVVSDMDGTLLNSASQISLKNQKAIQKLKDHHIDFAIASGRDFDGVYSIMHEYGLSCEAILGNGAQYVDQDGHLIMSCYMDKKVLKDVVKIFVDRHIPYMVFTTQGFYTGYEPEFVRQSFIERTIARFGGSQEDYEEGGIRANVPCNQLKQIHDFDDFINRDLDIIKVEAFSLDPQVIIPTKELLKDVPSISYLSSFIDNVEVTDQNAQKGFILEKVIKQKGFNKEEVMVLGDGMNDLSLFECFPYSYAPKNAEKTIQDLAYRIVKDCDEDGFSEAIDMMLEDFVK